MTKTGFIALVGRPNVGKSSILSMIFSAQSPPMLQVKPPVSARKWCLDSMPPMKRSSPSLQYCVLRLMPLLQARNWQRIMQRSVLRQS